MRYDVVVVGGGPAGATAAKWLAEHGVSVVVVDRDRFPREKPCGGGLPVRALKRFGYLGREGLMESYSRSMCMVTAAGQRAVVDSPVPFAAMVLRKRFDAGLVKVAGDAGAVVVEGKAATRIITNEQRTMVTLQDGSTVEASFAVVANGTSSLLARQLGFTHHPRNLSACYLEEYPVASGVVDEFFGEERRFYIHLNPVGIAGYGWVFPKREHVNIGLGEFYQALKPGDVKANLKWSFAQYLSQLEKEKIVPEGLQSQSPRGGVFPTLPFRQMYGDRFVLCGDTAGLTQPLTGEGIYYAMVSGQFAATALVKALEGGPQELSVYQRLWNQEFGRDYKRFYQLSKLWQSPPKIITKALIMDAKARDICVSLFTEPGIGVKQIRLPLIQRMVIDLVMSVFRRE